MKSLRRLMMMVAGILLLCSSQMTWINGQLPAYTSFGRLLSSAIHNLSGGSVTLDVELLNSIHMAPVIFVLAIVLLVSAGRHSTGRSHRLLVAKLQLLRSGRYLRSFRSAGYGYSASHGQCSAVSARHLMSYPTLARSAP